MVVETKIFGYVKFAMEASVDPPGKVRKKPHDVLRFTLTPAEILIDGHWTKWNCRSFTALVATQSKRFLSVLMRNILDYLEQELEIHDYHLRVCSRDFFEFGMKSNSSSTKKILSKLKDSEMDVVDQWFFYIIGKRFHNPLAQPEPAPDTLSSLTDDDFIAYTDRSGREFKRDVRIRETILIEDKESNARAVFDAQGRSVYVVVSTRKLEGNVNIASQSELMDEELAAMWNLCVEVSRLNVKGEKYESVEEHLVKGRDEFVDIRINKGSFQNLRNIHYKVFIEDDKFHNRWKSSSVYRRLKKGKKYIA